VGKNEYWFVDKISNMGVICGEIMYSILYPGLENISIELFKGGEIYDWRKGLWSNHLQISHIPSHSEKIYHIRWLASQNVKDDGTINNNEIGGCITGICDAIEYEDTLDVLPDLENCSVDLTQYVFRQKVQEIMFQSKKTKKIEKKSSIKNQLIVLYNEIRQYMKDNEGENNECVLMQSLLDDLHILYRTYNTKYQHMYSASRQSSNGRQQAYRTTLFENGLEDDDEDNTVGINQQQSFSPPFALSLCRRQTTMSSVTMSSVEQQEEEEDDGRIITDDSVEDCIIINEKNNKKEEIYDDSMIRNHTISNTIELQHQTVTFI
jgi:hypothetical protein